MIWVFASLGLGSLLIAAWLWTSRPWVRALPVVAPTIFGLCTAVFVWGHRDLSMVLETTAAFSLVGVLLWFGLWSQMR